MTDLSLKLETPVTPRRREMLGQGDCRPPEFSCDKDAAFELERGKATESAAAARGHAKGTSERRGRRRISTIGFLVALVVTLAVSPFVRELKQGQLCEPVLFSFVMCTGLIASGSRRRLAIALVSLPLVALWLNQLWPEKCPAVTFIVPAIAFLAMVTASLLRFILRAKRVDIEVLCAGISIYLILGLIWGLAYTFVAQIIPGAFSFTVHTNATPVMSGFTATYFSFTTLMTVGYGDITPAADVARMLAMLEAMTGTFFVCIMIARLVSLYSAAGHEHVQVHSEGGHNK